MKNKLSIAMTLAIILAMAATSLALADNIQTDGDTLVPSSNPSVTDCTVAHTFSGASTINYQGNTHFASGATLTISISTDPGITASGPETTTLPTWDSNGDSHTFSGISTNVPAGITSGTYKVYVTASGAKADSGTYETSDFFNVNVTCATVPPSNNAPMVAVDNTSVTVSEGHTVTNTGTWSDADASDTVTLSASVGTIAKSGTNAAGTWSWSFDATDGPADTQTVIITADDGQAETSVTFDLTVNNVAPLVAAPSWASTSVACRTSATLTGISFSDPGVIDYPWNVNIGWGDGSGDVNYDASAQGAQPDQTHTYNTPGLYTATIGVTDKDGGYGENTSGTLTVLQTYTIQFLQPFDGSSPSNLITNTMKSGRVVPVKVTIYDDCAQAYVADPTTLVKIFLSAGTSIGTSNDAVEVYADAGTSNGNTLYFRWSSDATAPGGGFWIYNFDSRTALNGAPLAVNTTYRLDVYVGSVKATTTTWALLKPVK